MENMQTGEMIMETLTPEHCNKTCELKAASSHTIFGTDTSIALFYQCVKCGTTISKNSGLEWSQLLPDKDNEVKI